MTIRRIWHGYTTIRNADNYEEVLVGEVIASIESMSLTGFQGIDVLRRQHGDEIEFVTIMTFDSIDSVRAFAGDDYENCYVPEAARKILKRFDKHSQHYELRKSLTYGGRKKEPNIA